MSATEPSRRQDDLAREAALDRIRSVYAEYEASGYEDRWRRPAEGWRHATLEWKAWLAEHACGPAMETVLDLGCGDGDVALALDAAGCRPLRYVGVDLLERRVDNARARAPWGEFIVGSADRLALEDRSVDTVLAITLLSSLTDERLLQATTGEIRRVAREGGRVLVYDIRYPSPNNRNVRPITMDMLRHHFPGWPVTARTMTLLPPLARLSVSRHRIVYDVLEAIPVLRSHLAAVLVKP